MGRNIIYVYKGIKLDSKEELHVARWLEELKKVGLVLDWKRADSIKVTTGLKKTWVKETQLKTKLKLEEKNDVLLRPSVYTPDFNVTFTSKGLKLFVGILDVKEYIPNKLFYKTLNINVLLEIKPIFDKNNMERLFRLNQKFIWETQKTFVNLVEPISLFKKTFIPLESIPDFKFKRNTKTRNIGDWKLDFKPLTLKDFLHESNIHR